MGPGVRSAGAEDETQRRPPPSGMSLGCLSIRVGTGPSPASDDKRYAEAMLGPKLPAVITPRPNRTMVYERLFITGCGSIVAGLVCGIGLAASGQTGATLPPTPPTSMSNQNSVTPPIAATPVRVDTSQRHRARVIYTNGLLEVHADNSSLNQILREISRQTGMKIVGGVADQRVFGSYGPAPAATVLQTLLDGTGTNILLQESRTHAPEQLVLTPQTGGPTPPPPSSPSYDATETEPDLPVPAPARPPVQAQTIASQATAATTPPTTNSAPSTPPSMPQPSNNVLGNPNNVSPTVSTAPVTNSVPLDTLPTPSTAPPVSGIVDSPNPPPAGSTTAGFTNQTPPDNNPNTAPPATATTDQSSPNGVKTPQQIYQELQQLQQKKANPQANPQGSSTPQ
jgi:hypothetical protein